MRLSGLLILAASLVLSACVASADNGTHWQLSTVDGKAPGWRATLDLGEAGRIAGQAPCNRFSGSLERSDEVFKPGVWLSHAWPALTLPPRPRFLPFWPGSNRLLRRRIC